MIRTGQHRRTGIGNREDQRMARTSRAVGKNYWALFLLLLLGIVLGSFLGHLAKGVSYLEWLDSGLNFSLGDASSGNAVALDLGVFAFYIGFRLKITIASILGAILAVFIYRRL